MTADALQLKLEELRRRLSVFQQISRENPEQVTGLLSGVLMHLQRSIEELQPLLTMNRVLLGVALRHAEKNPLN